MTRSRIGARVQGTVQGVGFRPFVRNLANSLGLAGWVGNDTAGVFIEAEGDQATLADFVTRLGSDAPPLASVEQVDTWALPPSGGNGFEIVGSEQNDSRSVLIAPDAATCADCLAELFGPGDRRYRYPFINCTNCGPRFTIVSDVPYDRPNTTMADFAMCAECRAEYEDPADRRFHAQPTCCPECGPRLVLRGADGKVAAEGDGALDAAVRALEDEKILALKGLGGYHLAVVASSAAATSALRSRKYREDKPFAVMVPDLGAARLLSDLTEHEEQLLASPPRPIVLVARRGPEVVPIAAAVAPGRSELGLMLPYTPLHHLIARALGRPFVLTSGNRSDEPIVYRDEETFARLEGIADVFLLHDRAIHIRTDDSVVRSLRAKPVMVRRSRGYVPRPIALEVGAQRPVLACGAELKNTFCVAKGRRAFVSHHIGDLENYQTLSAFAEGIDHFCRLFDVRPEVVAHDLHPEYLSTKYAMDLGRDEPVELVAVQHHHAHIASCLVDNAARGTVIGVAFDGLGLGDDGSLWGGEFLLADLRGYERLGHLATVAMPGGAAAIRQPWRMAASYLDLAFGGSAPRSLGVFQRHEPEWGPVCRLARLGMSSPLTSSMGRLFDAVSAIVTGRDRVNYEGQAAVELEQAADRGEQSFYDFELEGDGDFVIGGAGIVRQVAEDVLAGTEVPVVSARFHNTVVNAVARSCSRARDLSGGIATVALSGGVFQNVLLTLRAAQALEDRGFEVLLHSQVPPNDGGLSLGQAAIASARQRN
ncbi:MAG TPA: carbamoyltransferase HypF [Acidimicrobiales bacterium]|nr:carbamoyltransferase HypF [Acidimicrobiales bacterium]